MSINFEISLAVVEVILHVITAIIYIVLGMLIEQDRINAFVAWMILITAITFTTIASHL
jgi:hypothetical protein